MLIIDPPVGPHSPEEEIRASVRRLKRMLTPERTARELETIAGEIECACRWPKPVAPGGCEATPADDLASACIAYTRHFHEGAPTMDLPAGERAAAAMLRAAVAADDSGLFRRLFPPGSWS